MDLTEGRRRRVPEETPSAEPPVEEQVEPWSWPFDKPMPPSVRRALAFYRERFPPRIEGETDVSQ